MSYVNGKEVLPEEVLSKVQEFFSGGILYIPTIDENRCGWGTRTTTKSELEKRNLEIRQKKKNGLSIQELMDEYHLAYDTIKTIIYR